MSFSGPILRSDFVDWRLFRLILAWNQYRGNGDLTNTYLAKVSTLFTRQLFFLAKTELHSVLLLFEFSYSEIEVAEFEFSMYFSRESFYLCPKK